MAIETLRRNAKKYYEELYLQGSGIDKFLFREPDMDTSSSALVDRYISEPYSAVYREIGNQGHVSMYQGGNGTLYTPPIATEITPVPEDLDDAAIVGLEANSSDATHAAQLTSQIVNQHTEMQNMLKWKQSIDVLFDGKFYAKGENGADLGLGIDYGRDGTLTKTYDFTAGSATFFEAVQEMITAGRSFGMPTSGLHLLCSQDWLTALESDAGFAKYIDSPLGTFANTGTMMENYAGVQGLTLHWTLRAVSLAGPVRILTFNPGVQYKAYNGAAAAEWVPATKAALFSLNDKTYRLYRGVNVLDGSQKRREVGELVFDSYVENNPVEERLRSNSRHLYVYGNINHTVVSTGTFS